MRSGGSLSWFEHPRVCGEHAYVAAMKSLLGFAHKVGFTRFNARHRSQSALRSAVLNVAGRTITARASACAAGCTTVALLHSLEWVCQDALRTTRKAYFCVQRRRVSSVALARTDKSRSPALAYLRASSAANVGANKDSCSTASLPCSPQSRLSFQRV